MIAWMRKYKKTTGLMAAVIALFLGGAIASVTSAPHSSPRTSTPAGPDVLQHPATFPPSATPAPAAMTATFDNVTVEVHDVIYDVSSNNAFFQPERGNVFVTMQVTATNRGSSQYNFNPLNFVLRDAMGIKHSVDFNGPSESWSPVNLTRGASITKPLSFQATAGHPSGLILIWTPGFFSGDHPIPLQVSS